MHKLGCPARNNPYAQCECAAIDQREHTEQLRIYNENAPRIEQLQAEIADLRERLEQLQAEVADLRERLERALKSAQASRNTQVACLILTLFLACATLWTR